MRLPLLMMMVAVLGLLGGDNVRHAAPRSKHEDARQRRRNAKKQKRHMRSLRG